MHQYRHNCVFSSTFFHSFSVLTFVYFPWKCTPEEKDWPFAVALRRVVGGGRGGAGGPARRLLPTTTAVPVLPGWLGQQQPAACPTCCSPGHRQGTSVDARHSQRTDTLQACSPTCRTSRCPRFSGPAFATPFRHSLTTRARPGAARERPTTSRCAAVPPASRARRSRRFQTRRTSLRESRSALQSPNLISCLATSWRKWQPSISTPILYRPWATPAYRFPCYRCPISLVSPWRAASCWRQWPRFTTSLWRGADLKSRGLSTSPPEVQTGRKVLVRKLLTLSQSARRHSSRPMTCFHSQAGRYLKCHGLLEALTTARNMPR